MIKIFLDVETGGIGPEYSLLTAYLLATDENFQTLAEFDLKTKPNDGIYKVCGDALNINKIDLSAHDKVAISYKESGTKLYNWLSALTEDGKVKASIVGHNVAGDRNCICQHLINRGSWEKFTSYRLRDTQSAAGFLIDCGLFPSDVSGSLESLAKYFGIEIGELHTAKVDTITTMKVYQSLCNMLSDSKKNSKKNILKMVEYGWYNQQIEDEIEDLCKEKKMSRQDAIAVVFHEI